MNNKRFCIRRGVFETNSSSTHTVCVSGDLRTDYRYYVDNLLLVDPETDKQYIPARFGEFGWELEHYRDFESKLSYLLTMAAVTNELYHESKLTEEIFLESQDFKDINEAVVNSVDYPIRLISDSFISTDYGIKIDGYIDHQSCEDYDDIYDFLKTNGLYDAKKDDSHDYRISVITKFLFDQNVIVVTDNDNHY